MLIYPAKGWAATLGRTPRRSAGQPAVLGAGSGRASAIFLMTAGVFLPSLASVTRRSLAAATSAGVTGMIRFPIALLLG